MAETNGIGFDSQFKTLSLREVYLLQDEWLFVWDKQEILNNGVVLYTRSLPVSDRKRERERVR